MSVLIKGGRIVTAADDYLGDVFVDGERISLIGESLDVQADKVIDASGKLVLPAAVAQLKAQGVDVYGKKWKKAKVKVTEGGK